jgi:hypothetical protein
MSFEYFHARQSILADSIADFLVIDSFGSTDWEYHTTLPIPAIEFWLFSCSILRETSPLKKAP